MTAGQADIGFIVIDPQRAGGASCSPRPPLPPVVTGGLRFAALAVGGELA